VADRPTAKKKLRNLDLTVVGLSYRLTPAKMEDISGETPIKAKLVREPNNSADENAVAVYLTERPYKDFHIGYLSRTVAAEIAPRLDAGMEVVEVWLLSVDLVESKGQLSVKVRR
jgi:HIRAN domain